MGKRNFLWLMIGVVCAISFCSGCGREAKEKKVVAGINNYVMTVEDFEDEVRHSPYGGDKTKDLEELLDLAIRKQVLIQEAQKQGLDKRKTFMKTIERYWRQTLIKELLEKETRRIYQGVSKDKQDKALNDWIEGLYKKARIKINKKVLGEIK